MQTKTRRPQPDIRAITRLVPASGNLVQGQNEVRLHPDLEQAAKDVISEGLNHYSFFEGIDPLRRAVAIKLERLNGVSVDPDKRPLELMITPGATGGLVAFSHTFLRGNAALVFEPYYPYHKRTVESAGGRVDVFKLRGDRLELDLSELRRVCRDAARRAEYPLKAIIVCSPANPTGRVMTRDELKAIGQIAEELNLLILSDEVYEHFTLEASDHVATAAVPEAAPRTITISSFSKSWAVSGWRLGYAYGPSGLASQIGPLGNLYYVCTPTPLQHALARVLVKDTGYYDRLRADFARKRAIWNAALEQVGFQIYPSRSSFYTWARIPERFSDAVELNERLIQAGVAGVPGSAFMDEPEQDVYMRWCFAREDAMLEAAAETLIKALS
ncbi:MAG TPA: pyridoxal phosphate-dependent aminotransferase [Blastocatellia bacterium]|nr:pyridoxal phosphate-dependent aminotransferase [Blastocatellia bacterium]